MLGSHAAKLENNVKLQTKAKQLCQIREGFENCPRNFLGGSLKGYLFTFYAIVRSQDN
jgi:hypothetical protein